MDIDTGVCDAVQMADLSKLYIAPIVNTESAFELSDKLKLIKYPLAVTTEIFDHYDPKSDFWHDERKRTLRIIFYPYELDIKFEFICELLKNNFCVDILFVRPFSANQIKSLKEIKFHSLFLRFIFLEKKVSSQLSTVLVSFPVEYRSQIFFSYFPKILTNEFLTPKEILKRIHLRNKECALCGQKLKILVIQNEINLVSEAKEKQFYGNPSEENFYHFFVNSVKNEKSKKLFLLGLVQLIYIRLFGLIKEIPKLVVKVGTNVYWLLIHTYWAIKRKIKYGKIRFKTIMLELKLTLQSISGHLSVFNIKLFWKLRSLLSQITIYLQRLPGQSKNAWIKSYWKLVKFFSQVYVFFIHGFWKLRSFFISLYWLIRRSLTQVYIFLIKVCWLVRGFFTMYLIKLYWSFVNSKLLVPIYKVYWFVTYQLKTRISPFFSKINRK
ncbi:MAG: hypothetical protein WA160_10845 [Pseudobdellovibrio sp.]